MPKKSYIIIAIAFAVIFTAWTITDAIAAPLDDGIAAYKRQDYQTAFSLFLPLAEQGNEWAQHNIGYMYYNGQGVPQDYKEAAMWNQKAADQGNSDAQFWLGNMYASGHGVSQDYIESIKWLRKAAEQGHAMAQSELGSMYGNGQGVQKDYNEAVKWWQKAADQGNPMAEAGLGVMYYQGTGVPKDNVQAVKWLNLAAAQGFQDAAKLRDFITANTPKNNMRHDSGNDIQFPGDINQVLGNIHTTQDYPSPEESYALPGAGRIIISRATPDSMLTVGAKNTSQSTEEPYVPEGVNPLLIALHWLILLCPIILYYDATRHKIGKIKNEKSFLSPNLPAGGWAACSMFLLLAVVLIPTYIINRKKLIEQAKASPVEVNPIQRVIVISSLIFADAFFVLSKAGYVSRFHPGNMEQILKVALAGFGLSWLMD